MVYTCTFGVQTCTYGSDLYFTYSFSTLELHMYKRSKCCPYAGLFLNNRAPIQANKHL